MENNQLWYVNSRHYKTEALSHIIKYKQFINVPVTFSLAGPGSNNVKVVFTVYFPKVKTTLDQ